MIAITINVKLASIMSISYPLGYYVLKLMVRASDISWGCGWIFAGIDGEMSEEWDSKSPSLENDW